MCEPTFVQRAIVIFVAVVALNAAAAADTPGDGSVPRRAEMSDDFEAADWSYTYNNPKTDIATGGPTESPHGYSANGIWIEDTYVGQPDTVETIATPAGGLSGSTKALRLNTTNCSYDVRYTRDNLTIDVANLFEPMTPGYGTQALLRLHMPATDTWVQPPTPSADSYVGAFAWGPYVRRTDNAAGWPWLYVVMRFDGSGVRDGQGFLTWQWDGSAWQQLYTPIADSTSAQWWTMGFTTENSDVNWYARSGVGDLTAGDLLNSTGYGNTVAPVRDVQQINIGLYTQDGTQSPDWVVDDFTIYGTPEPASVILAIFALISGGAIRRRLRS